MKLNDQCQMETQKHHSTAVYAFVYVCVSVCGKRWISDLWGSGTIFCVFVFFECPLFLGRNKRLTLNCGFAECVSNDRRMDSESRLWLYHVTVMCPVYWIAATLYVCLLRQNEGEKHVKVFLEQSTEGPFADVMRRNVALMVPHYTESRFSFHMGCWKRQPRCI